jgi:hypothetical protein
MALQHFHNVKMTALKELCIYGLYLPWLLGLFANYAVNGQGTQSSTANISKTCTSIGALCSLPKEPGQVELMNLRPVLALIPWVCLFIMLLAKELHQVQLIFLRTVLALASCVSVYYVANVKYS